MFSSGGRAIENFANYVRVVQPVCQISAKIHANDDDSLIQATDEKNCCGEQVSHLP